MKKTPIFTLLFAFWIVPLAVFSQTPSPLAKIHIYNSAWGITKMQPSPVGSEEIRIKSGQYVLIQSSQDSLAFVIGESVVYLQLERGKNCYLRISQSYIAERSLMRRLKMIDEITEREFQWTLLANGQAFIPKQVFNF